MIKKKKNNFEKWPKKLYESRARRVSINIHSLLSFVYEKNIDFFCFHLDIIGTPPPPEKKDG